MYLSVLLHDSWLIWVAAVSSTLRGQIGAALDQLINVAEAFVVNVPILFMGMLTGADLHREVYKTLGA